MRSYYYTLVAVLLTSVNARGLCLLLLPTAATFKSRHMTTTLLVWLTSLHDDDARPRIPIPGAAGVRLRPW